MEHITISEELSCALEKVQEDNDIRLVVYTDGGCANTGDKLGGWGVHGYYYTDKETNSNSGCKRGTPTHKGYVNGRIDKGDKKANVIAYFDYFGPVVTEPTTNNVAEMVAVIKALELIKHYPVASAVIYTDSDYLRKGFTEWLKGWKKNNWKSSNGKDVANKELWVDFEKLYLEVEEFLGKKNLKMVRVDGHSGDIGNDKADELATAGMWLQRNLTGNKDEQFNIQSPDSYWDIGSLSKMFTEGRLFFDEGSYELEGNWYYQGSLPYTGSETEKEENLGKRVTDLTLSVLYLNNPEKSLETLQEYAIRKRGYQGIFKGRLDLINQINNFKHLTEYDDGRCLVFDDTSSVILSPSKSILVNGINTARLAYRLFIEFDLIRSVLQSSFSEVNSYKIRTLDITDYMYQQKKSGKKSEKIITKVNPSLGDAITIGHNEVNDIPSQVILTLGIDCPSKVNLGRLKDLNPKVHLLLYPQSKNKYSYYVAIETDEGIGVWCAPYSNTVLLPDNEDKS